MNKAKNIILNLENKDKENTSVINNLRSAIREKDDKILNLKLKIKNIESFNKTSFNNDDIISVDLWTSFIISLLSGMFILMFIFDVEVSFLFIF